MLPRYVRGPVSTTTAVAVPLSTDVPRKHRFFSSSAVPSPRSPAVANFSTESDSPVRLACVTKRSRQVRIRTSAGIMSPAQRCTTSPGTSRASGSSTGRPARRTVAVTRIIARSFSAAASARASCAKRRLTPSTIMTVMTAAARTSPVARETMARTASSRTRGFRHARSNRRRRVWRSSLATTFGPYRSRRRAASSSERPSCELPSRSRATAGSASASSASRGETRIEEEMCFGARRRFRGSIAAQDPRRPSEGNRRCRADHPGDAAPTRSRRRSICQSWRARPRPPVTPLGRGQPPPARSRRAHPSCGAWAPHPPRPGGAHAPRPGGQRCRSAARRWRPGSSGIACRP